MKIAPVDHDEDRMRRDTDAMARAMAQPKPELAGPVAADGGGEDVDRIAAFSGFSTYPQPIDCGTTTTSAFGDVEYVTDLIRPGRIHVVAAEEGTGKTYAAIELGVRPVCPRDRPAGTSSRVCLQMLKQIAMLVDGQGVGVVIVDSPIVAAPGIPALREMRMG